MNSSLVETSSPIVGSTSHSKHENPIIRHALQEIKFADDDVLNNGEAGRPPGWNVHRVLGFCYLRLIETWVPITIYFKLFNDGYHMFFVNLGVGMLRECTIEEEQKYYDDLEIAWEFDEDEDGFGLVEPKKRKERTYGIWNSLPIFTLNLRRKKLYKRWFPFSHEGELFEEMPESHFFLNESLMHTKIIADIDNDPHFEFLRVIEPRLAVQSPIKEYRLYEDKFIRQRYYYTPSGKQRETVRLKSKREIG